jgi:hypothetical protein
MPGVKKKGCFTDDIEAAETEQRLRDMVIDTSFNTESSYSANETLYPDNVIPFVDKHMAFLRTRSGIDPQQYLSNLRLMTRIR